MDNIIEIKNLRKTFGEIVAVDNISFSVKKGSFFAFLGLNGAGKSTTINIICGVYKKDNGEIFIDEKNIDDSFEQIKPLLGVVYQDSVLDKQLSVKDNLISRASLYGITKEQFYKKLDELDRLFKIKELLDRPLGKLSGGQRRRVDIVRAVIHSPKILILDEPTTGLDPKTRKMVWNAVDTLRKENNLTIFLTTHYMEEVSDADNVIILDKGKIVAEGTPLELKNKYTGDFISLYNISEDEVKTLNLPYKKLPDCFKIEVDNTSQATNLILTHPSIFKDYEITKGKMDDVFLAVTGKNLSQGENNEQN